MSRNLAVAAVIGFALATGACAQFETSHESLTPSAPSPIPNGSSEGPLVGTWQPPQGVAAPDPSTCGNFQWVITSQSDVAVQGSFSAECGGGVSIAATVQGTLNNPTTVTVAIQGTGIINGLGCPFTLNGVGTIFDNNNAITIPYTGTTCYGPVSGTQTLRRPTPPPPPAPDPTPEPGEDPHHVGPGPLSAIRAQQVIYATADEHSYLLAPLNDTGAKMANAEEMLRRCIWHLHLAGYQAGRQRNPSGAISLDKLTIRLEDGGWHAYDIMTNFDIPGTETRMLFLEVTPPNPIGDDGIPD
ncbi:MAG TPA: hypothetical protein VJP86_02210 [Vicinamibacterales bacterium]|jgi:hypothetical protein|nr:hypothetical protein [Vicinamibacterales bacterium]